MTHSSKQSLSKGDSASKKTSSASAQSALDLVRQQKQAVARNIDIPWWQGPLIGICMAMLVVSHAAATPVNLVLVVVACLGIFTMLRYYRNQPLLVSGLQEPKTRALAIVFFVLYLIHYFGGMWLYNHGHSWVLPLSAISIFVVANAYGYFWLKLLRRSLEVEGVS